MINELQPPKDNDKALWRLAKKRVGFKRSFFVYAAVNIFLWCLWFFTDRDFGNGNYSWPWPLWVTLGWGIGIAFQYRGAYSTTGLSAVQKEYEKLKNNNQ